MCDTAGSQQEEEGGWSAINHQLISGDHGEIKGEENNIDVVVKAFVWKPVEQRGLGIQFPASIVLYNIFPVDFLLTTFYVGLLPCKFLHDV